MDLQIHALQRVLSAGADVSLAIAGDGPERQSLEALARELGVGDRVKFLGELPHDDVLALMRERGTFLATSDRNEGWGATVNEAMSMGCCVIASEEMGSVPYLIQDGVTGLSFQGGDADLLSSKILQALSNPKLAKELGEKAQKTVEEVWSAREAAARFAELAGFVVENGAAGLTDYRPWACGPLSSAGGCADA